MDVERLPFELGHIVTFSPAEEKILDFARQLLHRFGDFEELGAYRKMTPVQAKNLYSEPFPNPINTSDESQKQYLFDLRWVDENQDKIMIDTFDEALRHHDAAETFRMLRKVGLSNMMTNVSLLLVDLEYFEVMKPRGAEDSDDSEESSE